MVANETIITLERSMAMHMHCIMDVACKKQLGIMVQCVNCNSEDGESQECADKVCVQT